MVSFDSKAWEGVVIEGALEGSRLEVRRQRFPWALYVFAITQAADEDDPLIGFAVGKKALAEHLESLGLEVTWEDGRGPLAPERDRPERVQPRRRRRRRSKRPHLRPMGLSGGFSSQPQPRRPRRTTDPHAGRS